MLDRVSQSKAYAYLILGGDPCHHPPRLCVLYAVQVALLEAQVSVQPHERLAPALSGETWQRGTD